MNFYSFSTIYVVILVAAAAYTVTVGQNYSNFLFGGFFSFISVLVYLAVAGHHDKESKNADRD